MRNQYLFNKIIDEDLEKIYLDGNGWSEFRNAKILVTGAYGMLASYLVFFFIMLNEKHNFNIELYCQGRDRNKFLKRYKLFAEKTYFKIITDNLDADFDISADVEYIIHAASIANPSFYTTNPVEVEEPNVIGTYYLLQMSRKKNIKKFLFFSSGDVYGEITDQSSEITEEMYGRVNQLESHSCYGESKRMGETFTNSFYREYSVNTVIARIGHTYGPTMDIENDPRVFASFVRNAIKNENIVMLSDGSAKRPFCYLADATAAFLLLLIKGKSGEAYNVCNTEEFISIEELANIIVEASHEKLKVLKKDREDTDKYLEAKFNKENKPVEKKLVELGWKCNYSTLEGFERVIDSLKLGRENEEN